MMPRNVIGMIAGDGFRADHPAAAGAPSEAEYTGLHVRVMSAPKARSYSPGQHEIAISIHNQIEPDALLSSGFASVLRLVFMDTGRFANIALTGVDMPDDTMNATQADAVVEFVRAHNDARVLMIQCAAGVSRSRSLAAAICVSLDLPYVYTVFNDDVYTVATRAFERTE